MSSLPSLLSSLAIVTELQTAKYINVASLAIWVFDYTLSFENEVRLVWGRRWDFTRCVFTLSRYVTIVGVVMTVYAAVVTRTGDCSTFGQVSNIFHILGIVAAEALLILRTYAFWQRSKKILSWMLAYAVVSLVGAVGVPHAVHEKPSGYTNPGGCVFIPSVDGPTIQYSFLVGFEIVMLSLTTYRMIVHYRDTKSVIVTSLYRGSMLYMACMILITLANIIMTFAFPIGYRNSLDSLQLVLHGILASRILFNLRECDIRNDDALPISNKHTSNIHFAKRTETATINSYPSRSNSEESLP